MKYSIGMTVKFKGVTPGNNVIPSDKFWSDSPIPRNLITHGNLEVHKSYFNTGARIVNIFENYYLVKYRDDHDRYVILGFKEDYLETVKVESWKKLIEGGTK